MYYVKKRHRLHTTYRRVRTKPPLTSIKRSINQSTGLIKEPAFYLKSLHSIPPTRVYLPYSDYITHKGI